jgi:hypothetical protein
MTWWLIVHLYCVVTLCLIQNQLINEKHKQMKQQCSTCYTQERPAHTVTTVAKADDNATRGTTGTAQDMGPSKKS